MKSTIKRILLAVALLWAQTVLADEVPYLNCGENYSYNLLTPALEVRAAMCWDITGLDMFVDEQTDTITELQLELLAKQARIAALKKELRRRRRK